MRLFQYEIVQSEPSTVINEYYVNKKGNEVSRSIYFTNSLKSAVLKVRTLLQKAQISRAKSIDELLVLIEESETALLEELKNCEGVK